jgi:hypothetical protein
MTALTVVLALRGYLETGSDEAAIRATDAVRDFGGSGRSPGR